MGIAVQGHQKKNGHKKKNGHGNSVIGSWGERMATRRLDPSRERTNDYGRKNGCRNSREGEPKERERQQGRGSKETKGGKGVW